MVIQSFYSLFLKTSQQTGRECPGNAVRLHLPRSLVCRGLRGCRTRFSRDCPRDPARSRTTRASQTAFHRGEIGYRNGHWKRERKRAWAPRCKDKDDRAQGATCCTEKDGFEFQILQQRIQDIFPMIGACLERSFDWSL